MGEANIDELESERERVPCVVERYEGYDDDPGGWVALSLLRCPDEVLAVQRKRD